IDDRDLIAELAELMITEGAENGRLKDSPDGEFQSANTVGQAWGVRAFQAAGSESVNPAADFLVDQQCPDGGFRLFQKGDGCTSSVDATTFAVIALQEAGGHGAAVADARTYLNGAQAGDGSLSESGGANSNSTGLAAVVLSSFGDAAAATAAADWIVPLQATSSTPGLKDEAGAIAFDSAAFDQGADGISDVERDQWVRTSVQAIHALSFASQAEPEPEPGPVASMELKASDAKPEQGEKVTITATGRDADGRSTGDVSDELSLESSVESDTIKDNTVTFNTASSHVITATYGDDGPTASITIEVAPSTDENTASGNGANTGPVSSVNGTLPDTGSSVETWQLLAAAALLVTGAGLVLTGRGRRASFAPSHARR
ncbi:MAG: prenyltransferase/squalene oxidase repeat-containing protein, partial [Aeromicrobium sp.]|uniref:prenyltransferase/squalene oxidase repeat-containing protein n=1 Tax=Aeromicrobium sp. TaxID=1871063 RepID=UPI003C6926FA